MFTIAEIRKFVVSAMAPHHLSGMFYWTPVLFCPGNHFPRVGHYSVPVSAIKTIQFFNTIEVDELMSVHDNIVGPFDPPNAIKAETDMLVHRYGEIKECDGNYHPVNKRRGQNIPESG